MNKMINLSTAVVLCLLSTAVFSAQTCKPDTITNDTPDSRYTNNNDGTVTDKDTGLMWKRCSEGFTNNDCTAGAASITEDWQDALVAAEAAIFASHSDWRLPNRKELTSLVNRACSAPAINETLFPATLSEFYWASSPVAAHATNAWTVNFTSGFDGVIGKHIPGSVRLVRAGQ